MSLASVSSSTPSSVLLHSAVPADYHLIFAHPPLFATEPSQRLFCFICPLKHQHRWNYLWSSQAKKPVPHTG